MSRMRALCCLRINGSGGRVTELRDYDNADGDSKASVLLATFDQYRGLLFSIAYRMLGSVSDAEDMLQNTFLRWQQSQDEEIRSPRAFLVTIVSRLCINQLQSRRAQREQYVGEWLPEPIVTDIRSDPLGLIKVDETLSMAFLLLLERLTPVERAVFLLHEVFEYGYGEIASLLELKEPNCRQIFARARKHISEKRPRFHSTKKKQTELFQRFMTAITSGKMEGLLEVLSEDVALYSDGGGKAVAVLNVVRGADKVARGIIGGLKRLVPSDMERRLATVNGKIGVVNYHNGGAHSVLTFEVVADKITSIYVITNPDKLKHIQPL